MYVHMYIIHNLCKAYSLFIVNRVLSPDLPDVYSLNPYQGCEHGCIYCYARDSHNYWGFDSGKGFEENILVKKDAPLLLEKIFQKPGLIVKPLFLSGNTDCYQPAERKYRITRQLLELCLRYKHPVSVLTKNALVKRDLDLFKALAQENLVSLTFSLTTLNEDLRLVLEPRTATTKSKLHIIEEFRMHHIPVYVMMAPIIPALNSTEVFKIAKAASEAGALGFNHSIIRLNGSVAEIFTDWVQKVFPDRASKIINGIRDCHGGKLGETKPGLRMRGEGYTAAMINQMVKLAKQQYFSDQIDIQLDTGRFVRNKLGQLNLF